LVKVIVDKCVSASQALKVLNTGEEFDLVITDYAMPGMNGLDLATKIREVRPSLPIILATGYAELQAEDARGFTRLAKPYTQDQLTQAVDDAVGHCVPRVASSNVPK
jgi:CheY-like chemotaxis protein